MTIIPFDRAKTEALARYTDTSPDRLNCCQTVIHFGLAALGHNTDLVDYGRYFGGGIGGMGCTCGVLTGAALTLGLRDSFLDESCPKRATSTRQGLQELIRSFEHEFGACDCRRLTGHDLSTPEGMAAFKKSEAHDRCPLYISWTCDRLLPLLTTEEAS
jgi:C_GCAxxG_C_C family probable redox protein